MSNNGELEINEKAIDRLKKTIVIKENRNLKTGSLSDAQMVAWIKKKIEEEVKCCLNQ
ncbi:hypothetical protein [Catenisphaera adipataccumulans]|uniref:Uncharacterized protein n=1 Tax=Catenisphaera adipataccumulans TaxID=700500 RepID=A0A7W8CWM2_9FIRM|nr:hypothetical protein [Catenisphaera adipataccumulans]MBB5182686.1 hypothetical protein [Catenisphaera adipataccumulans]